MNGQSSPVPGTAKSTQQQLVEIFKPMVPGLIAFGLASLLVRVYG